jgi:hypothetical protein
MLMKRTKMVMVFFVIKWVDMVSNFFRLRRVGSCCILFVFLLGNDETNEQMRQCCRFVHALYRD